MRKNRLFMRSLLCLTLSASMVLSGMAMPETAWGGALADNDADLLLDVDELLSDDVDAEGAEALSDGQDELSEELSEDVEVLDESTSDPAADPAAAEADQGAGQGNKDITTPSEGSGDGVENPETDQAQREDALDRLNALTSHRFEVDPSKKYGDIIASKGDFEVPPFGLNDDESVMNGKILTAKTPNLVTFEATFNKNALPEVNKHKQIYIPYDLGVHSIKDTWAEMLSRAFGESKEEQTDLSVYDPFLIGAYVTDLQYGDTPIEAFNDAIANDPYLGAAENEMTTTRQVYACGATLAVKKDIEERYKTDGENPDANASKPCYCAVVVDNVDRFDEKAYDDIVMKKK